MLISYSGGSGEIRTHGTLRYDGFQDRCLKPGSATLPLLVPQVGLEPTRISALASKTSVATITPPGQYFGTPKENRTPLPAVKGRCPNR